MKIEICAHKPREPALSRPVQQVTAIRFPLRRKMISLREPFFETPCRPRILRGISGA